LRIGAGLNSSGNLEYVITGKENWAIRRERYAPHRPGVGVRIDSPNIGIPMPYSGLRPSEHDVMNEIASMIAAGIPTYAIRDYLQIVANKIIATKDPHSAGELKSLHPPTVFEGPFFLGKNPLQAIIGGQKELDDKLDRELRKMQDSYASKYIG